MRDREADIIRDLFSPLAAKAPGSFSLRDDAALVDHGAIVVTTDMLISGVHFLPNTSLDLVARKLIRVNLSDLAAKGAKPLGYFLCCAWPQSTTRDHIAIFADGLRTEQEYFDVHLFGGDTTKHVLKSGPLTVSATFFGEPRHGVRARENASIGDDVFVSGTIGDAGLGLKALKRDGKFTSADRGALVLRHQLPTPRLSLGAAIANVANAAMDVSDGLIADSAKLGRAAGVNIRLEAAKIPLSSAASRWAAAQDDSNAAIADLASFGDDYEILFTAPASMRRSVAVAAKASRTVVSRIGTLARGEGVTLIGEDDQEIVLPQTGFDHFDADENA